VPTRVRESAIVQIDSRDLRQAAQDVDMIVSEFEEEKYRPIRIAAMVETVSRSRAP
jgi:hypothetical protein